MKKSKLIIDTTDQLSLEDNLEWRDEGGNLAVTATVAVPKKSSKKFFSDLDAFFESAIDDLWQENQTVDADLKPTEKLVQPKEGRAGKKSFFSGLDALFSSTTSVAGGQTEESLSHEEHLKRVTFLFKKDKLEVLKNMAKKEKLYLRDIISKVLDQYLEEKGVTANKDS